MAKNDYLAVCNNHGVPLADFAESFCKRCLNPECSRSSQGSFAQRVSNWQERLFLHPSKMDPADPRYSVIAAQKFMTLDPEMLSQPGGGSAWIDPRDLESRVVMVPVSRPQQAPPVPPIKAEAPEPPVAVNAQAPLEKPQDVPKTIPLVAPPRQAPLQTPFQQGRMLESTSKTSAPKPKDSWDAPQKSEDGAKIVSPGTKVRF